MKKTQKKKKINKTTMRLFKNLKKINGYYFKYILDEEKLNYLYKNLKKYTKIKSGATKNKSSKISQETIIFLLDINYKDSNIQLMYEAFEKVCYNYGGKAKSSKLYDDLLKIINKRTNLNISSRDLVKIKSELDPKQRKLKLVLMIDDIIMGKEGETHDKDIDDIIDRFNSIRAKLESKFIKDSKLKKIAKILNKKSNLYDSPTERSNYLYENINIIRASRIKNLKITKKSRKKTQEGGTIERKGKDDCSIDDINKRMKQFYAEPEVKKEVGDLFIKNNISKNSLFDCMSVTDEEFNNMKLQQQQQYNANAVRIYFYYKEFPGKVDKYYYNELARMKSNNMIMYASVAISFVGSLTGLIARLSQ